MSNQKLQRSSKWTHFLSGTLLQSHCYHEIECFFVVKNIINAGELTLDDRSTSTSFSFLFKQPSVLESLKVWLCPLKAPLQII